MFTISPEVKDALARKAAVVALESTIISHGMPYPQNLTTAQEVEEIVRSSGAVPATIAVIDGEILVGLSAMQLELVAQSSKDNSFFKLSSADLPFAISQKQSGATTVAATIFCAQKAGIKIMATGGIGGVHRGCTDSFDVSADLSELARTSVGVVCSGVKSILDIGKTLELLETLQVPVIGYQTKTMPAFYSMSSEFNLALSMQTPQQIAQFLESKWQLALHGAAVIAVPPPAEYALDYDKMEAVIKQSLAEAVIEKISGKAVTPFLLERIKTISAGTSLAVNCALIKNNAKIAAQIAVSFG